MVVKQWRRSEHRKESGFTLIELLVVILIIGILAAIAIPMFLNQRKSAVDASIKSDIKNLSTVVETWRIGQPLGKKIAGAAWRSSETTNPYGTHNSPGYDFAPSDGVEIKVNGLYGPSTVDGYCLTGWSTGSNYPTEGDAIYWNSQKGGFVDTWSECINSIDV